VLTARATDDDGNVTTSAPVGISVRRRVLNRRTIISRQKTSKSFASRLTN
jgi:hypothetical protein